MTNRDKHFRGQQENEIFVGFFRHHWITLVREFLLFFIFLLATAFVIGNFGKITELVRQDGQSQALFLFGFIALTFYFHRFFMRIFNYFTSVGVITDMRIIDHGKTLFVKDVLDSIDMAQIQNMEMLRDGFIANLLGYGDIKIFLNASSVVKTFSYVPNIRFHFRTLTLHMEKRKGRFRPVNPEKISPGA